MSLELGFPGDPGRIVRDGLLVEVHVGQVRQLGATVQHLHAQTALIDTGARDCYVDVDLARELQLRKVDRQTVTDVTGNRLTVDVYSARIRIEALDVTLLDPCPSYSLGALSGRSTETSADLPRTFCASPGAHFTIPETRPAMR